MDPLLQRVNTYLRRWAGQEVQAAADLQAVQAVVDRTAHRDSPACSPTGEWVRALLLRAGEKSPVTGDCHAGSVRGMTNSSGVQVPCGG